MSKMDDMRAMREARYAAAQPRAGRVTPAKKPVVDRAERSAVPPDALPEGLCGHRAISGRTCTRDKGHAAKSHRYS